MVGYVVEDGERQARNRNYNNYWDLYAEEMLGQLGLSARQVAPGQLEQDQGLAGLDVLIVGYIQGERLTAGACEALESWVKQGGMLIGFGVSGLDRVFGIETCARMRQEPDDYTISASFDFTPHAMTHQLHLLSYIDQRIPILSECMLVRQAGCTELGRLYDTAGKWLGCPAVSWHAYGKGLAGYIAFDMAKTVWLLHQGRPLGNSTDKASKMSVTGTCTNKVPYADEMVWLLQNMIACRPQPFIYQIPPQGDKLPDALFYWGGDEYRGPIELSLGSSDFMKSLDLPYHINIEIERHPMTDADLEHIHANGHEVSLYYHFMQRRERRATPELFQEQSDLLYEKWGFRPGCTLFTNTRWQGWSELARWMMEAGGTADNSFTPEKFQSPHHFCNGPHFGFGRGTAFPFFFYDDADHGNRRLDFIEEPIVWYEMGHRGSVPPYEDRTTRAADEVHAPIDVAVKYHLVMNLFYHPTYIVNNPPCREAIREVLRYIDARGYTVMHMGNNAVADWWMARARSRVEVAERDEASMELTCTCEYPGGMIVKVPVGPRSGGAAVTEDGRSLPQKTVEEFGNTWMYAAVPHGRSRVRMTFGEARRAELPERLPPTAKV